VRPDLTWSWKDEGEFERGCPLGLISAADDAGVRAARDEVVGLVESRGGPFGPSFEPDVRARLRESAAAALPSPLPVAVSVLVLLAHVP
jgi:hypothetical protein